MLRRPPWVADSSQRRKLMKISPRQNKILKAIIREYVKTALPVSSSRLAGKDNFNLSPATIRNEMAVLEARGLIKQPHTSSGRVPTDQGYRYFVDYLLSEKSLSREEQKKLALELLKTKAGHNKLLRRMTKILSRLTGGIALTSVQDDEWVFDYGLSRLLREPEFDEKASVSEMVEMVDLLDEHANELVNERGQELEIYIGRENPLSASRNCSLMVSRFSLPSGERGVIAILGPKRMRYGRNMSILDYMIKLLGGATLGGFFLVDCGGQLSKFLY